MNQRLQQIDPRPVPRNEPPKPAKVDYDKPVRLKQLLLTKQAFVYVDGTTRAHESAFSVDRHWNMELDLRKGVVRIWSSKLSPAPVTTVKLGGGESWQVEGDLENLPEAKS